MSDIKTNIPLPVTPLTGPDGRINEVWWRFFLDIFNRTGGGSGDSGTVDPVYPDVLLGISAPMNEASWDEQSAVYPPAVTEVHSLQEMTFAPLVAEHSNVSFTSITYSGQLISTVATGTSPMVISSTTKVTNLNADLLDSGDWASPGDIGVTTPNNGKFKVLSTDGSANVQLGTDTTNTSTVLRGANSGAAGGTSMIVRNGGAVVISMGNKSAILGTAYDATPLIHATTTIEFDIGIKVPGGAQFLTTSSALTNGAGASAGTITNAPTAGNPTKWIGINDNGTIRYVPSW